MTDTDDRILDRIRKLLARAEHPATPPAEAEACSAKAAALMTRHLIDQAMVDAARPGGHTAPVTRTIALDPPYATAKAALLAEVAAAFHARAIVVGEGRRCSLVGFPADLSMIELLFTSLLLQASAAMIAASRESPRVKAFRRAFLFGYAGAIGARLRVATQQVEQDATTAEPGTALVLVDRAGRVDAAVAEQFPALRTIRTTVSSGHGLSAGRAAGADADLSMTRRRVGSRRGEISA